MVKYRRTQRGCCIMEKLILADVKTTYYKVVNGGGETEQKRYRTYEEALRESAKTNGEVVKVTKRMKETIEFEKMGGLVLA